MTIAETGSEIKPSCQHSVENVKKKIEADNVTVYAARIGSMLGGVS